MNCCEKCGTEIAENRKYCESCSEKNNAERGKRWVKEHPEQKRLNARNYIYRHLEENRKRLHDWRTRNPEKVKLQRKRAKIALKLRRIKSKREREGRYDKIKIKVECKRCSHEWKTKAKRPQCLCGWSFPRDYYNVLLDRLPTKACK